MFSENTYVSRLSLYMARIAAVAAALLSLYMLSLHIRYTGKPVSWGVDPCVDLAMSRWGYWLKLPVAIPGFLTFVAIAVQCFRIKPWQENIQEDRYWKPFTFLLCVVAAMGAWSLFAQLALLRYLCPTCMVISLSGMMLFGVFVFIMKSKPWTLVGAILAAGLVVIIQLGIAPPSPAGKKAGVAHVNEPLTADVIEKPVSPLEKDRSLNIFETTPEADYEERLIPEADPQPFVPVVSTASEAEVTNTVSTLAPVISQPRSLTDIQADKEAGLIPAPPPRTHVSLADDKIYLDLKEAPWIGSPDATYILGLMYDYTVPGTADMIRLLRYEVLRYKGRLAIALMPAPLDEACNESVRFTPDENEGACEYAKYSLQVWLTNPEHHADYQKYILSGKTVKPLHQAKWAAEKLIDYSALTSMDLRHKTQKQLGRNCSYWKAMGHSQLPAILNKKGRSAGVPQNMKDMDRFIDALVGADPSTFDEE
jgi:uncharacterized membrane protein